MATLADYGPEARAEAKQVREVVATLHEQLVKWNLVVWTATCRSVCALRI